MLNIDDLTAALNDPNSPAREKLLQHLSLSPLDPAAAYQQLVGSDMQLGGVPRPDGGQGQGQDVGFNSFINPQNNSREANPLGTINLANSTQVMPQSIMPGESSGIPQDPEAERVAAMKKMLEGMGGAGGGANKAPPHPSAPSVGSGHWSPYQAAMIQTQAVNRQPSLAELLRGR